MSKMKRILAFLISTAIVLSAAAGCSNSSEGSSGESSNETASSNTGASTEEEITLKVMTYMTPPEETTDDPLAEAPLYEQLFQEYTDEHPNVKFEITYTPQSYDEKLAALFSSGDGPDLFWYHPGTLSTYADQGLLQPLDELIDGPNGMDYSDVYEGNCMYYKGNFYGWGPVTLPQLLYFNKTLFDEANVEYPNEDWTWDDLIAAAKDLTKKDGDVTTQYGFQCDEYNRMFLSILRSYGGEVFNDMENPTEAIYNSEAGVKAVNVLLKLVRGIGAAPLPADPGSQGTIGYREAFYNGQAAMILDGSWTAVLCSAKEGLDYGVALVPKGDKRAAWIAPSAWGISTQTKYLDTVWDVWKHMNDIEATLLLSYYGKEYAGQVPTWKSATEDSRWGGNEVVDVAIQQLETAELEPIFSGSNTWYWTNLPNGLQDIVLNEKDVQSALDEMVQNDNSDFFS